MGWDFVLPIETEIFACGGDFDIQNHKLCYLAIVFNTSSL